MHKKQPVKTDKITNIIIINKKSSKPLIFWMKLCKIKIEKKLTSSNYNLLTR
jgi:hypothetical protein